MGILNIPEEIKEWLIRAEMIGIGWFKGIKEGTHINDMPNNIGEIYSSCLWDLRPEDRYYYHKIA